jgi:hypothetical protein
MTDQRDFERMARAWLDLMPDEAPDRVFTAVLQAVESVPQERPPLGLGRRRFLPMQRLSFAAAVGVAGILAVAGLLYVRTAPTDRVAAPSATAVATAPASASAVPAPAAVTVPPELQGRWVWRPAAPDAHIGRTNPDLVFGRTNVSVGVAEGLGALVADATTTSDGGLELVQTSSSGDCRDIVGRYAYSLSLTGRTLSLTPRADACPARETALAGSWVKEACPVSNGACLGRLDAGTYASRFIDPRLDPGEPWRARYGGLMFTVVDGWANTGDSPTMYSLVPLSAMAGTDPDAAPAHELDIVTQPTLPVGDPCARPVVGSSRDRSVAALMAGITANPALRATALAPIELGGASGMVVDLELQPSYTGHCPDVTEPMAVFLTSAITGEASYTLAVTGHQKVELVLLDLGGGDVVGAVMRSADADRFDADVYAAMWVLNTLTFPS